MKRLFLIICVCFAPSVFAQNNPRVFPGREWEWRTPEQMGLSPELIDSIAATLQGAGCIVKDGYMVKSWGTIDSITNWWSSFKPVLSTMLFYAIQEGKVKSVDETIGKFWGDEMTLEKDRSITFRHLGSQISGYARPEGPGEAYSYNDYALQLYLITFFRKIYGGDVKGISNKIFSPLQPQDGIVWSENLRFKTSVRDFARIAWWWANFGKWGDRQLIDKWYFDYYMTPQVARNMPMTAKVPTNDNLGIRSCGGDSYSPNGDGPEAPGGMFGYGFNWWFNSPDYNNPGQTTIPGVPLDLVMSRGFGGHHSAFFKSNGLVLVCARGAWSKIDVQTKVLQMLVESDKTIKEKCLQNRANP